MYELLVLGRLARTPMHGYMIAKVIENIIGPNRRMQWGALYPVLSRLEQEGLIRAEEEDPEADGRARKVYAITDAGRRRLHDLLMDTERHAGEYDSVFCHKVALFSLLSVEERLRLSRHYAVFAQQNLDHLERRCREMCENNLPSDARADILEVMNHRITYWKDERVWAEGLIARQLTAKEAV
jgi:DNA-binding PadR family transcriptional regulator